MPGTHEVHNRTNAPGTCLYCGQTLRAASVWRAGGVGYLGNGYFCTLRCGFRFALVFARAGKRLVPFAVLSVLNSVEPAEPDDETTDPES